MVEKGKSHKIAIIILCVVSVIIIVASVVAVVLNHQKNAPTEDPGQHSSQTSEITLSNEDYEKNKEIVDGIIDYIFPLPQDEAIRYVGQKAEEYRNDSVGLPVAQIEMNVLYNALEYEKAAESGERIEKEYDVSKYPVVYQLEFYYEMMSVYKALGQEEKATEYEAIGKRLSEEFYGNGRRVNVEF